jgi:PKD repeat protein
MERHGYSLKYGAGIPGVLAVLLLVLTAFGPVGASGDSARDEGSAGGRAYTPHDPIRITDDSDLTAANGVTEGGSNGVPYTISGWEFTSTSKDGIYIDSTMAAIKIKSCKFHDFPTGCAGISFGLVDSMVYIENCVFENNDIGIKMKGTFAAESITKCTFDGNREGVNLDGASPALYDNTFKGGTTGIALVSSGTKDIARNTFTDVSTAISVGTGSKFRRIFNNTFNGGQIGISHKNVVHGDMEFPFETIMNNTFSGVGTGSTFTDGSKYIFVSHNIIKGGEKGVEISGSTYIHMYSNIFEQLSSYALKLTGATSNIIEHNNFMGNNKGGTQAYSDTTGNYWSEYYNESIWWKKTEGYLGNHWSDLTGPDEDRDGFVDTAYLVEGGKERDNYPLAMKVPYAGFEGPAMTAQATARRTSGPAPLSVDFVPNVTADASEVPFTYSWTFGDGGTSTIALPSHTYSTAGTYSAAVTVSGAKGGTAQSAPVTITVTGGGGTPLSASASANKASGAAPLTVAFTGSASGGTSPYTYSWEFGDGSTGTGASTSHTYDTAGTYSAVLTVADSAGQTKKAAAISISVTTGGGGNPLTASSSADRTSGVAPLTVQFTGTASGGSSPYSFSWNFGDGSTGTGSPSSHTYNTDGVYDVILTVTDSKSATKTAAVVTITVGGGGGAQMTVAASASPSSGPAPLNVFLVATVSGGTGPYTYEWAFGDGTNGTEAPLNHKFQSKGTYNVLVTVRDSAGHQRSSTVTVMVKEKPQTIKSQPGFEVLAAAAALAAGLLLLARKRN